MILVASDTQVIFNDHLLHGSAARTSSGDRKMIVFRYLPQEQSTNRFGYEPSKALMARLTPVRQQVSREECRSLADAKLILLLFDSTCRC